MKKRDSKQTLQKDDKQCVQRWPRSPQSGPKGPQGLPKRRQELIKICWKFGLGLDLANIAQLLGFRGAPGTHFRSKTGYFFNGYGVFVIRFYWCFPVCVVAFFLNRLLDKGCKILCSRIKRAMHEELEFKADVTAHKVCSHIRLKLNLFGGDSFVSLVSVSTTNAMPKA